ncbi:MAG: Rieske (2Fe-2S) protein [Acidobacteriaceae bacterium]|nr:Rieske (2Fe-2S) protein [Acidobacteriaceae bacterium]
MSAEMTNEYIQEQSTPAPLDRRAFLERTIYTLMSLIAGAVSITSALYLLRPPKNQSRSDWADAGDLRDFKPGVPKQITFERNHTDGWRAFAGKDSVWVVKNPDDSVTAFVPSCTHLGCAYAWQARRGAFVCPCHGSVFSQTGQVITGPAPRPLDRYQIEQTGSRLRIGPILKSS